MLVKEMADACMIPGPYLAKIVNALRRVGLVQTQRGVGGGVTLARRPQDISLYDICTLLGDPITEPRCMLGVSECSDERACPAHKFWSEHRAQSLNFLKRTTVADIAAFETRRRTRALKLDAGGRLRDTMRALGAPSFLGEQSDFSPLTTNGHNPVAHNGNGHAAAASNGSSAHESDPGDPPAPMSPDQLAE